MKRAVIAVIVTGILGAIVYAGLASSKRQGAGLEVHTVLASSRAITEVVKATGRIDPREKVDLSAHVVAKIEKLFVDEGDEVAAGQPVIELEREAFQAAWERSVAQRQIAQNQVRQTEIDLRDATRKAERYARLVREGVVSSEQTESATLERESAELRLEQARGQLRQARADLEKAQDDLDKVVIYAPIGGRVIALNAEEGEVVVSGVMNNPASVIATIADLSEILVEIDVDETEIVAVAEGQPAVISVDAVEDHDYHGRVDEIGSSGFQRPGKGDVIFYSVKILLEDADARLRPGMTARAEIAVETHRDTIVVPIQSVVYRPLLAPRATTGDSSGASTGDDEEQVVFVVEAGEARRRAVDTGLADTTDIEIVHGLEAAKEVITGPYRVLRDLEDGTAVRVQASPGERASDTDRDAGESEP